MQPSRVYILLFLPFQCRDTYPSQYALLTSLFYSYFVIFGIVKQLICCTYSSG